MHRLKIACIAILSGIAGPAFAGQINWSLPFRAGHQFSNLQPMSEGTRFQLGVFASGFVPTSSNTSSWIANWRSRAEISYNTTFGGFGATLIVEENPAPFTVGAQMYVWGYRPISSSQSEWILLMDAMWVMPSSDPFSFPDTWNVANASTVILGSVDATTHAVKTASVATSATPAFLYAEWLSMWFSLSEVGNPAISGTTADPDGDGRNNLMEYTSGTSPLVKNTGSLLSIAQAGLTTVTLSYPGSPSARSTSSLLTATDLQSWTAAPIQPTYDAASLTWQLTAPMETKRFWKLRAISIP